MTRANDASHLAMRPCPDCGTPLLTLRHLEPDRCTSCWYKHRVDTLQAALVEANEMVCRHSMPWGWPEFQARNGLPTASEVLASPPSSEDPK